MKTPTPRTDTTVLDDNDDIASFSSQQTATIDVPNLCILHSRLPAGGWPRRWNARYLTLKHCSRSTTTGPSQLLARSATASPQRHAKDEFLALVRHNAATKLEMEQRHLS